MWQHYLDYPMNELNVVKVMLFQHSIRSLSQGMLRLPAQRLTQHKRPVLGIKLTTLLLFIRIITHWSCWCFRCCWSLMFKPELFMLVAIISYCAEIGCSTHRQRFRSCRKRTKEYFTITQRVCCTGHISEDQLSLLGTVQHSGCINLSKKES